MSVDRLIEDRALELLAPAGEWEALRAAVANGADAVYFGLNSFNARHRAANFPVEELPQVMRYLHEHNVRGYVAFNTLIFSDELEEAVRFVTACAAADADAMIVQDLGIARLIHSMCPTLPIHGSTQMTLTEAGGINLVRKLGVQRVILARELSLEQIARIRVGTDVPLEVFVHGALCVAYSGQCLTSEALGGRSANRGQCAQACRLPYELLVDGELRDLGDRAYLLSPQDLAAYDRVGELQQIGVRSVKIEGRLKSAHYVAAATQAYRSAIDAAHAGAAAQISEQQKRDLMQSFSRGFTHGFLDGVDHQQLVHARFPKSRGVRMGVVHAHSAAGLVVALDNGAPALNAGDGVVFDEGHPEQDEQGGRIFSARPVGGGRSSRLIEITLGRGDVSLRAIADGAIVWKTDDPAVRRRLEQSYARETVARREPLTVEVFAAIGQPLRIRMRDGAGNMAEVQSVEAMRRAEKFPLSEALVREQLGRLGNTPYELSGLTIVGADENTPAEAVMAPKSVLNELRRQCVERLMAARKSALSREISDPDALSKLRGQSPRCTDALDDQPARISVLVRTMDQLQAALDWRVTEASIGRPTTVYCDFEDVRRYRPAVDMARAAGQAIGLATLRVVKPGEHGLLKIIAEARPDVVLVRNLAALAHYREHWPELALVGDYALNVANELTAGVLLEAGLTLLTPSYDLNWQQLTSMLGRVSPAVFEVVVHQHMPMFHMEHCVFCNTLSQGHDYRDCGRPCEAHRVDLRDRVGQAHALVADAACRNTLFNAVAQSAAEYLPRMMELGLRRFRVEMLRESAKQAQGLLERYAQIISGKESPRAAMRQLRVLNQLGVTRGTLEHV